MNQLASEREMGGPIITPASRRSEDVIEGITGRAVIFSSPEQWSVGREKTSTSHMIGADEPSQRFGG